ncbi:MAG: hypothetical protein V3V00_13830 [Saprospiraceae bacterium]
MFICMVIFACHETKKTPSDVSESEVLEYVKIDLDTIHATFDPLVQETSGLMKINDTYWTHNDSGGDPYLFEFDINTGDVIRSVLILGVKNVDWEEITIDSTHFYIGNFGNNFGNRDNLAIYKGRIDDLLTKNRVNVEQILFSYPDQNKFYHGYNHNHDAEAMVLYNEQIYIFSKNWEDRRCKLYVLPKVAGTYSAKQISEFDTKGTITGAALSLNNDELMLLGYVPIPNQGFDPFIWKIRNWEGSDFFSGTKKRYDFTIRRQMEGVVYMDDRTLAISSEDENGTNPSLFKMNL